MPGVTSSARRWLAAGLAAAFVVMGAIVIVPGLLGSAGAPAVPHFVEEASEAGLVHRYDGEFMFFVGGGVALFDCDGDGRQDLYLAGGERPAGLFRNRSERGGALAFEPVRAAATDLERVVGAYPLDVDGDGIGDLALLRVGENALLRGTGDCRFERANERWGYDGAEAWTAAFSATWERPDALPTLAFGNYLVPSSVEDRTYVCDEHQLVRPAEDGTSYAPSTALGPGLCTLSILFSDWDRSGRRDLRLSNDRHYSAAAREQLFRLEPNGAPRPWTADEGWEPVRIWGMGIASHDLTGDGYPEVFLSSQSNNRLQALVDGAEEPRYADIAIERGANAHEPYAGDVDLPSTAWHAEFQDANNDGLTDLFVAKGNVEAQPDYAMRDPSNLLIGQPDGTFVEGAMEAGLATFARARGAGLADLNLDGLLDLVVVNRRENVGLWRNVGNGTADAPEPMGSWVNLRLAQDGANRDAIGAWVEVAAGDRVMRREVTVGGGHAGGQLGWIHFGLADADRATVTVTWPDGEVGAPLEVEAGEFHLVERDADRATRWEPPEG
jgi:enediyne biosynthesis protein E4